MPLTISMLGKISADNILIFFFSYFFQKAELSMKCCILFSEINKKNVTSLSSAEFTQKVVKVKLFIEPLYNSQLFTISNFMLILFPMLVL